MCLVYQYFKMITMKCVGYTTIFIAIAMIDLSRFVLCEGQGGVLYIWYTKLHSAVSMWNCSVAIQELLHLLLKEGFSYSQCIPTHLLSGMRENNHYSGLQGLFCGLVQHYFGKAEIPRVVIFTHKHWL